MYYLREMNPEIYKQYHNKGWYIFEDDEEYACVLVREKRLAKKIAKFLNKEMTNETNITNIHS